jgi:ubiquitin carboxyl-terminal hydrolase L5
MSEWCLIESDPGVGRPAGWPYAGVLRVALTPLPPSPAAPSRLFRASPGHWGQRTSQGALRPERALARFNNVNGSRPRPSNAAPAHPRRSCRPIYGLVFLFKWDPSLQAGAASSTIEHEVPGLYFSKQVVHNACATQALLSVVLNAPGVTLSAELSEFRDFMLALDPETRGVALGDQDTIRSVHNSFARADPFSIEHGPDDEAGEAFHFVAYVPHNGRLYELDGLQRSPIDHGAYSDSWVTHASGILGARITAYGSNEIRFNLMAVTNDSLLAAEESFAAAQTSGDHDMESAAALVLAQERAQRAAEATENARRRHNYVPLMLAALRQLAAMGELSHRVTAASDKYRARIAAKQAKKKTASH